MENFLYFIRDKLVGLHYFIYSFVILFFMFSIIGHLFKQKYAKFDIKLNTSQKETDTKKVEKKEVRKVETNVIEEVKKEPIKEEIGKTVVDPKAGSLTNSIATSNTKVNIKETNVSSTPVVQVNQIKSGTEVPTPTPMPATPDVKQPEKIPAKPTEVSATQVKTKVETVSPTNTNGSIPEL